MKIGAYCRVSTEKEEQIESLKKQKEYFTNFCKRKGYELVCIYADEGISGKQMKNRKQFLKMIKEAKEGRFDAVAVKDVSRFARNTVDFLEVIRDLKAHSINVIFVNHNMNIIEGSEFSLTLLSAVAQEESAKLSERIKWGKNITAKKGRVPNFVYGYDKVDTYTLRINKREAQVIKKIYDLFIKEGLGTLKIAQYLNEHGIKTKRQSDWYQTTVARLLKNELYTGKIINKKSEVQDFITGKRKQLPEDEHIVADRPDLKIISNKTYEKALLIFETKRKAFKLNNKRLSTKYPFSNLIICGHCNYAFRRVKRKYKQTGNTYIRWVDSKRNVKGKDACTNKTVIDEKQLMKLIINHLQSIIKDKDEYILKTTKIIKEKIKKFNIDDENNKEKLDKAIKNLNAMKQKYIDMYTNNIIDIDELKKTTLNIEKQLNLLKCNYKNCREIDKETINIKGIIKDYYENLEKTLMKTSFTNLEMRQLINNIMVFDDGTVKVNFIVPLCNYST